MNEKYRAAFIPMSFAP